MVLDKISYGQMPFLMPSGIYNSLGGPSPVFVHCDSCTGKDVAPFHVGLSIPVSHRLSEEELVGLYKRGYE